MKKRIVLLLSFLALVFQACPSLAQQAAEILLDDYEKGLSGKWETKSFKGNTDYGVITQGGRRCIFARSNNAASGLFYKISFETKQFPILEWEWRVDNILSMGDARKKEGDDYAARVYVVFPSLAFWNTRALNYIWANRLPKEEAVLNPFTQNAVMIAVESGKENLGRWVSESRNIYEDYIHYFKEDPPKAGAVAIMTDTDNTGQSASACYGPIHLLSAPSH